MKTTLAQGLKRILGQTKTILLMTGLVFVLGTLLIFGSRFLLIRAQTRTDASWGQIRQLVQRQLDLAPELLGLVKGDFPAFKRPLGLLEGSHRTLLEKQKALTPKAMFNQPRLREYEEAQLKMALAVERILRTVPDLKSAEGQARLQAWVGCYEGTQRLLKAEKHRYNSLAQAYNRLYQRFFISWVAERFELQNRPLFKEVGG